MQISDTRPFVLGRLQETVQERASIHYNGMLSIHTYFRRHAFHYTIMMTFLRIYHQKSISAPVQVINPRLMVRGYKDLAERYVEPLHINDQYQVEISCSHRSHRSHRTPGPQNIPGHGLLALFGEVGFHKAQR